MLCCEHICIMQAATIVLIGSCCCLHCWLCSVFAILVEGKRKGTSNYTSLPLINHQMHTWLGSVFAS